jgi:serine/threonine-protein kinase
VAGGDVRCWGEGAGGQLGNGLEVDADAPVPAAVTGAVALSAGARGACAVLVGDVLRCWGPAVAEGTLRPSPVPGVPRAVAVSDSESHTCALTPERRLWCWDSGFAGGPATGYPAVPVDEPAGLTALGESFAGGQCGLEAGGRPVCWVRVARDDGTPGGRVTYVVRPALAGATAVTSGMYGACALVGVGVWCWYSTASPVPVPVPLDLRPR